MSQKKIGAKIVIDGEQEFRSALQQSKTALKEFDSEMKLVTTQFKDNEKSMEALKAKQEVYQKQQAELTKQSKILVEQIEKANKAYKEAEDAQAKQVEKIKKIEDALAKAKTEYGESSDEVKQLEAELSDANQEYEKQERQITSLSNKISKWNTDLNKTETELVQCDRALKETDEAIDNYGKEVTEAETETKKFGIVMNDAAQGTDKLKVSLGSLVSAQVVVDVLRNCANAIKEVATAALDVGMKFESSMSNVEALSGATGDELEALGNKAREMGAKTIYSASESADAFSYMALAGWDAKQMLDGIEPVLNLAAAANMDLAEASDIVTDYITAFGLKAEDAAHFSDAMATAMSTSNTTVELLGESYKNCAATCGSMGISMEDATAVLATMANAGVKGGEAGTALNTILTRVATNTKHAADKLEGYGVAVYDAEGNMNSLSSILNGLGEIWADLSDEEQANLGKIIAGTNQYSKFQTIMLGVSDAAKEGGMSFNDYAESLRNCDGAAEQMASTMQDNLKGDITILQSALEGLGIATEGVFDDAFRDAVQGATDAVGRLTESVTNGDLGVSLAGLSDAMGEFVGQLIDGTESALPGMIDGLTWFIKNLPTLIDLVEIAGAAYIGYEAAVTLSTIATEGLTVALELNPIGLVVGVVAALTMAFIELADSTNELTYELSEEAKETDRVISESETLNGLIEDNARARADAIAQIDAQAAASKKLVDELFAEETSQGRKQQILSELKSTYPELNAAMNEHGELIGQTKEEMEQYIDTSLKLAKVEAAKEQLTAIAKEQFEAEQQLARIEEQVADAVAEVHRCETEKAADAQKHVDMNGMMVEVYNEYDAALEGAREGLNGLLDKQNETRQSVTDLGEEYQKTLDYINDNEGINEAAGSLEEMAEAESAVAEVSEDLLKEFQAMEEALENSISSSLDLTKQWSQKWDTSTSDMTDNIQSQIDGIQNWSDNFSTLANNTKVAIDDGVLKYLADMGTEGAGLVQELVDTLNNSPEELAGWSAKMAEYMKLEDSVSSEITASYADVVLNGTKAAAEAVETGGQDIVDATQTLAENISTELTNSDLEGTFEKAGQDMAKGTASGIESEQQTVTDAGKKVAEEAAKQTKSEAETGFKEAGRTGDSSMAEGLREGQALAASSEVSAQILEAVSSVLNHDSGYAIGADWMSGLAAAVAEEGKKAIQAAANAAAAARQELENVKPADNSGGEGEGGGGGEGGEKPSGNTPDNAPKGSAPVNYAPYRNPVGASVPSLLSYGYAPLTDSIDNLGNSISGSMQQVSNMSVNVELYGDAKDIFQVVRNQNTRLVTATGYNALA